MHARRQSYDQQSRRTIAERGDWARMIIRVLRSHAIKKARQAAATPAFAAENRHGRLMLIAVSSSVGGTMNLLMRQNFNVGAIAWIDAAGGFRLQGDMRDAETVL